MFKTTIVLIFGVGAVVAGGLARADLVVVAKDSSAQYSNCVDDLRKAYRQALLDGETKCLNKTQDVSGAACDPGGLDDDSFESGFSASQASQIQKCWNKAFASAAVSANPPAAFANSGKQFDKTSVPVPPRRPADLGGKSNPATKPKTSKPDAPSKSNDGTNGNTSTPADNTDQIQAQADADVAACWNSKSQAVKCCGNPLSCASASDQNQLASLQHAVNAGPQAGQSITDYCSQVAQLSSQSGRLNSALAGICAGNQSSCQSTCGGLVQKYQSLLDSCDGCSAQSIYQEALNSLSSGNSSCQQLKASANALAMQSISTGGTQAKGNICAQQAQSEDPSSGMPGFPNTAANSPYGAASLPADTYGCQMNPNSPACRTLAAQPGLQTAGATTEKIGFQSPDKSQVSNPKFNLQSMADAAAGAQPSYGDPAAPKAVKAETVPNGGGSGFPGASSNTSARLQGQSSSSRTDFQMPSGSKADIFHGLRSGGYSNGTTYAMAGNANEQNSPSTYVAGRALSAGSHWLGMDLKQFLPGGSRDPNRRLAGFSSGTQILGKGEDLFKRVSNKMEEKCKLGLLFECWP